ncbi:LamG-like jellyroll fold domain-containing protein [Verrucomicrobiaceae bacterium 227]
MNKHTKTIIWKPICVMGFSALVVSVGQAQLLNENFDATDGGFVSTFSGPGIQPWIYNGVSGTWSVLGDEATVAVNDYLTSPAIPIATTGGIEIEIEHKYSFEAEWDGGVIQISIEGGDFHSIPTSSFSANPYTFAALIGTHDLTGQEAFNGDSADIGLGSYITSTATSPVGIAAGSTVQVRLTAGFDANTLGAFSPAWEVTAFRVTKQVDGDSDGMPDDYEIANSLNPADAADAAADADSDLVSNLDEYLLGTDPGDDDSDDDGLKDNVESNTGVYVSADDTGTDPLKADSDGDGLSDGVEDPALVFVDANQPGSDPNKFDTDGDGFDDGLEVLIGTSNPTNPASRPLRAGLLDIIAYWDFNDNSNPAATFDLVKGFQGDLKPGTLISADATGRTLSAGDRALDMGVTGGAGTGVIVEQARFLNLAGIQDQIGISFWVNMPSLQNSMAVYANSPAVERAFSAHVPWSNGQAYWDTNGCCDGARQRMNVAADFVLDTWSHVVLNKNGDTKAIWVNGVKLLEATNTDDLQQTFTRFYIGTDSNALNTVGLLDDMAIYADALTDEEIAALANGDDPRSIVPANDDSDLDGMPDAYELANNLNPAVDDAGDDLDSDGSTNFNEYLAGTDPNDDDSDDDGLKDGVETKTGVWVSLADTGTDPLNGDSDGDGLGDGVENPDLPFVDASQPGTDPNLADSDGDTFADNTELELGTDPSSAGSFPEGGVLDLLVYFDFNGQATDQTGNAGDATLVGNAALTTGGQGVSGSAADESLDLGVGADGSAATVAAGSHFSRINLNNAAAVSFWQFNTVVGNSSAFWLIAPTGGNNQRGFQAHTPWGNGTVYLDVAGQTGGAGRLTSTGATITEQWQHFVFQKSSTGDLEIWIDGVLASTSAGAPDLLPLNGAMTIGAEGNSLNNSFSGRIDDLGIFSESLSPEQVAILASGVTPPELFGPLTPFIITSISYDQVADRTTLTWNSKNNGLYAVDSSADLKVWEEVQDDVESGGGTTTVILPGGQGDTSHFYRIRRTN